MEDKIFDFAATKDALGALSADLIALESALKIKRSALAQDKENASALLLEKDKKIEALCTATQKALTDIDQINSYIEEVL